MRNYAATVISQYATSPTIGMVVASMNEWVDPSVDIQSFYDNVWNIDTAVGWGLDVWGRIVGVGRVLQIAAEKYFGFNEATNLSADPFGQSPFYSGQQINNNFILSDDGFRVLILAKAFANICDGSIPAINYLLMTLFAGRGNAYVLDGHDMTMQYAFEFDPTPVELAVVAQSGVLPRPTGVAATFTRVYP